MYGPSKILAWLESKVQQRMRLSRMKTLCDVVGGAMQMRGCGVLALGRAMEGPALAKHRIKRVDRFLGNESLEVEVLSEVLFRERCPASGEVVVLVDWTDRHRWQQLTLAVPCDGRALPFYSLSIPKGDGSGAHAGLMVAAEEKALAALAGFCPPDVRPIIVADRGFGNSRWLSQVTKWGWLFVQRVSGYHNADVEGYTGQLRELGMRRGWRPRDFGWGSVGDKQWGPVRLVSVFDRNAREAWYLLTNMDLLPHKVVQLYQRRMWIEAMFRDLKNRNWGLGLDHVKLSNPQRNDRLFIVLAMAYTFLCAIGAAAENKGLSKALKANTATERVLALLRIGHQCTELARHGLQSLMKELRTLPT